MAPAKVPSLDKSGSASKTVTEQTDKLESKKYLYLHWINQGLLRKLKQNRQRYNFPFQMIKNGRTIPKTHENKNT